jgi:imidazolonepropionase-like amidohydrolase
MTSLGRAASLCVFCLAISCSAQQVPISAVIRESGPLVAIKHVTVIDGTGSPPAADQAVVIKDSKILTVGPSSSGTVPQGAHVIDGSGKTLIPGLVGMHEHLFFPSPVPSSFFVTMGSSFPRLYLASGVTTARTTGSIEPYTDLNIKQLVDKGTIPGPKFELTGPYVNGKPSLFTQMHELSGPDEAREFVRYWHSVGFTSVKAYIEITPEELRATIDESHKLGMKVTGHLCSVSFREAAEMGIDNLEHGPFGAPDSELSAKRNGTTCGWEELMAMDKDLAANADPEGPEAQKTIAALVAHHVAITSTLAVFEPSSNPTFLNNYYERIHMLMTPQSFTSMLDDLAFELPDDQQSTALLHKEMKFERAFVKEGGLLLAGCDPTGDGHTLAGLGDQRELELLVESGFSVPEAVHIYTMNGATFLGEDKEIGSIAVGKKADLVLLNGDLGKDPTAIEKPEIVFKDGVGFDSVKIYESMRGTVGIR